MNAEELKRYDAYPILVHALREALEALDAYGTDDIGEHSAGNRLILERGEKILKALETPGEITPQYGWPKC